MLITLKETEMTEQYSSPEFFEREDYPETKTIWRYSIDRPVSWDELKFITEGTGVKVYTNSEEEYSLGHGAGVHLGLDEDADMFPYAGINITRRTTDKLERLDGVDISLEVTAKPSDEYSLFTDLWESDRERIEVAVDLLGGKQVI